MTLTPTTCSQCGLPFARGGVRLKRDGALLTFCCSGCAVTNSVLGASGDEGESALFLARLGFSAFLSMNIMALSWMIYDNGLATFGLTSDVIPAFEALLFILSLPIMFAVGFPFAKAAWRELQQRMLTTDSLITLGSFAAFGFSCQQLATGGRGIYFDTATATLVLVTLGRYLEATAKLGTSRSLKDLVELQPDTCRVLRNSAEVIVPASEVQAGEMLLVFAGERIPLDGVIAEGTTSVDESPLTGESLPRTKRPGENVFAATLNIDGSITIRTTATAAETVHASTIRLLEEAQRTRSPLQHTVDRISAVFLPAVLGLALLTVLGWMLVVPWQDAMVHGLTVLVVSCPCALGIGTPLATTYALGKAARKGVLLRSHAVIERLAAAKFMLFDKTGTLTTGEPTVSSWITGGDETATLQIVSSLEAQSSHPLGHAIVRYAERRSILTLDVRNVRVQPGIGIEGEVRASTGWIRVEVHGVPGTSAETELAASWEGREQVRIRLTDTVRSAAREAIGELHALGIATSIVSGDAQIVVDRAGAESGIREMRGGLMPADKLAAISEFRSKGVTVMVGDGINDAPSLAAADAGIALAGGTDIAKESADAVIIGDHLERIPWLIGYARKVVRTIRWNLFWAFAYNSAGIALATAGLLEPIIAAAAMVASSVSIIAHSMTVTRT